MESRIYSLLLFLDLRSYALWNRLIVNIALLFRKSFRKCMLILSSNVGVWQYPKCTTDYFSADYPSLIFSQMIEGFGVFWPLAKRANSSRLIFRLFCAAKIPLFRKSHNFLGKKMTFAKIFLLHHFRHFALKCSLLSKKQQSHFSQMISIPICQRTRYFNS